MKTLRCDFRLLLHWIVGDFFRKMLNYVEKGKKAMLNMNKSCLERVGKR